MAVDLQLFKDIILEQAALEAASEDAAAQLTWVRTKFLLDARDALSGGFQATSDSMAGTSFAGIWNGASSLERAAALKAAIEHLKSVIANDGALPIGRRRLDFSGSTSLG